MKELFEQELLEINSACVNAVGSGIYIALFMLALLYILMNFKDEDKNIRTFLGIYPVVVFIIVINPIFAKILIKFIGNTVYWRVFWLLPIGIMLAYMFTRIIFLVNQKKMRIFAIICILTAIIFGGNFIYSKEFFKDIDNYLKVPDPVLEIIYEVSRDDESYKKIAGPEEFMVYTRQVDGTILVEQYRSVFGGYDSDSMISYLSSGNTSEVAKLATEDNCNYIIVRKDTVMEEDLEEYGYKMIAENYLYKLYKED